MNADLSAPLSNASCAQEPGSELVVSCMLLVYVIFVGEISWYWTWKRLMNNLDLALEVPSASAYFNGFVATVALLSLSRYLTLRMEKHLFQALMKVCTVMFRWPSSEDARMSFPSMDAYESSNFWLCISRTITRVTERSIVTFAAPLADDPAAKFGFLSPKAMICCLELAAEAGKYVCAYKSYNAWPIFQSKSLRMRPSRHKK